MKLFQHAASFASIGVIAVITAFTVQVQTTAPIPATVTTVAATSKVTAFQVDNKSSKLLWTARKVTGEHTGTINISNGTLNVENNALQSGSFKLDTRSIAVTDIKDADGNAKLTGHLKSDDFFAVEKFPAADFAITGIKPHGNNLYDVTGKLTIKGITNDISFPATVVIDKGKLTANAKIKVDRTKYDIKFRSKNYFENLGDKAIYDDFDLDITLLANAQ
ncbi:YceI family protein [Chitinophaga pinensis]|uniref:YceI family protein n=1 Tax=Chitinophaga pinensis (strain ATCC 43595 / DSM 2588 / LMG 13176 / NBRC 15968 / NCIMB 11800 / UQM 2034) TaxID=485918 RepID=A0A979FZ74_CHIPD|nr:YceI family protein [Chitinophaga pinensis]ACU57850.1 YceI family protein [Chitinophaga pinensis DSM 2588]